MWRVALLARPRIRGSDLAQVFKVALPDGTFRSGSLGMVFTALRIFTLGLADAG
jgi:hypothetical protein